MSLRLLVPRDNDPPESHRILVGLACSRDHCTCKRSLARGFGNTHCPAHDDSDPSLTVSEKDGKVLVNCKYGCSQDAVVAALRSLDLWERPNPTPTVSTAIVYRWPYVTEAGAVLAYHCRRDTGGKKQMWWELPDGRMSHGDVQADALPLYRLPELQANAGLQVLLCEGEKAADAAAEHQFLAVSLAGGASQTEFGDALAALRGRTVVLWPDVDEPGVRLMQRVGAALLGIAAEVRWLAIPDAQPKDDAADYFTRGGDAVDLERLIYAAPAFQPAAGATEPVAETQRLWTWQELLKTYFVPPNWLIDRILPEVGLTILGGKPKVGKSWLALQIAGAVGSGDEVLGRKAKQGRVLYFCIEDRKERIKSRGQLQEIPDHAEVIFAESLEPLDGNGMAELETLCDQVKPVMVVIDTLAAAKSGKVDENAAGPMADLANGLQRMAHERRLALLLIAHHRKGLADSPIESLRGSSALAGAADMILGLGVKSPAHILEIQGRDTEDATYRMEFEDYRWKLRGNERELAKGEANEEVLDALRRLGESEASDVAREVGVVRTTAMRRLKDLEKLRQVVSHVEHSVHGVRVSYRIASESDRVGYEEKW